MFESLVEHTTKEAIAEAWQIGENLGVYKFNMLVDRGLSDEEALDCVRYIHSLPSDDRAHHWHTLIDRLSSDQPR